MHAISDMKTAEEAQSFLDVAHDIRAERAAELAMLQQQLEQCRRETRILESKMVIAVGRVVDADRGIAAMRQLMIDKGLSTVSSGGDLQRARLTNSRTRSLR